MIRNQQTYIAKENKIRGVFNRALDKKVATAIKKAGDAAEAAINKEIEILSTHKREIFAIHHRIFGGYMKGDPSANDYLD